ncbi:mesenchyme-specific cell surface glycoprotein-like [Mizuhopecten yessoensis]|uniref:mesenchyme-specific cell surface glycoprotein-like n=1 Tax=Mizuhopecten yessoensis TaxID=6573 RepID=UPI000B45826A|nr:mesenchyme-specific cell surface glycoprotein-like [Mizuhopecten yessoensis]
MMKLLLIFCLFIANALAQQSYTLENVGYLNLPDCSVANIQMFSDSAVKAAMHEPTRILYVAGDKCVHVLDVSNAASPTRLTTKYFNAGNDGKLKDIEVCGNTLAVLVENPFELAEGHVYLCSLYSVITDTFDCGQHNRIAVGDSPKNMKYTSDCEKLLVTNEGRAGLMNGVFTDHDGTVTIINKNLAVAGAPCVRPISFKDFDSQALDYVTRGIRWAYRGDHNNGINTELSQDIEPEDIAISDDNTRAYITLPENNAIAVINLINDTWVDIYPMGTKDWRGSVLDASDRDGGINLVGHYHVKSIYQPTGAVFVQGTSTPFVVTANTGAMKTYTIDEHGVDFSDNSRGQTALNDGLIDYILAPEGIILDLSSPSRLGRVHISTVDGRGVVASDLIADIHLFGGRDLGFWNPNTFTMDHHTGDDLELKASSAYPDVFNGDCSDETVSPFDERDTRSDDMGPEPHVMTAGHYNSIPIIAAGTRNGLIYLYYMALNTPVFSSVYRLGNTTAIWGQAQGSAAAGDGLISDMGIITQGILGNEPYMYVIGRGTGTVSFYKIHLNV